MAKRDKETITLGSGKLYLAVFSNTMPSPETICVDNNLLGWIKGGASLEYTAETYEEKDDLGMVSKIITTSEEVLLKAGLLTWNGETLTKLVDTGRTTTLNGRRTTKIGGLSNATNTSYAICFKHEDAITGDLYVLIKGRNQAGFTLTWATDSGTVIEPEFKALPHDSEGTLVQLIEEIGTTSTHTVTLTGDAGTDGFEYSVDGTHWETYSSAITVGDGDSLYIKAKLMSGKTFTQWASGITTNPFHILNITSNISYSATTGTAA